MAKIEFNEDLQHVSASKMPGVVLARVKLHVSDMHKVISPRLTVSPEETLGLRPSVSPQNLACRQIYCTASAQGRVLLCST